MNKLKKIGSYFGVGLALLGSSLYASGVHAAADAAVTAAAEDVATVMQENVIASITAALPIVVLGGVLILIIGVVWKFGRRFFR